MIFRPAVGARGVVSERVLVARLFGDAGVKLFHVFALQSVVHIAAGVASVLGQALELSVEKGAAHAHAIHRDVIAKEVPEDDVVLVGVELGIIHPVGDEQNDFAALALRVAVLEQLRRVIDGVVERLGGLALDDHGGFRRFGGVAGGGVAVDGRALRDGSAGGPGGRSFIQAGAL